MLAAAKYIGAGLAAIGLTGAGKNPIHSVAPSEFFDKVHEADRGQETDNVFIIAKRFIASGKAPNADIINQVLKLDDSESVDSGLVETFGKLYEKRLTFHVPLDRKDMSTLRGLADNGKPSGVYIFVYEGTGETYVGSSKDLIERIRNHYYGKSHGRLAQHILANKVKNYTVSVVVLPQSIVSKNNILALEQFLMFLLKPSINFLKVANSSHKEYSVEQVEELREAMGNKIYIYYKGVLVYIFNSNRHMFLSLGESNSFGNRVFVRGKGTYRVDLFFSKTEIKSAPINLMSVEDFRRLFKGIKEKGEHVQALPSNSQAVVTTHNGVKVQHQSMTAVTKWLKEQTGQNCSRATLSSKYLDSHLDYLGYKLERVNLAHPGFMNVKNPSKSPDSK